MLLTKEVIMNLNYRGTPIVLDALQGDSGRAVAVHLVAGETPWEIPQDAYISMQYQCEDGSGGIFDSLSDGTAAYSVNESTLTIYLAEQLCAIAGCTKVQVTIICDGVQLSTFPIEIRVTEQVNGEIASGEYINLQKWLLRPESRGDPGYTPVKGVDYYTDEDKAEMVDAVLAAIPNGDEVMY